MFGCGSAGASGLFMWPHGEHIEHVCVYVSMKTVGQGGQKYHFYHCGECLWIPNCKMHVLSDAGIPLLGNYLKQHNPVPMMLNISYFVCSLIKYLIELLLLSRDSSGDSRKSNKQDRLVLAC